MCWLPSYNHHHSLKHKQSETLIILLSEASEWCVHTNYQKSHVHKPKINTGGSAVSVETCRAKRQSCSSTTCLQRAPQTSTYESSYTTAGPTRRAGRLRRAVLSLMCLFEMPVFSTFSVFLRWFFQTLPFHLTLFGLIASLNVISVRGLKLRSNLWHFFNFSFMY